MTNNLAEAWTMKDHGMEVLVGFVVMGVVEDVLVDIGAAGITGSMWGFSTICTLYCFCLV